MGRCALLGMVSGWQLIGEEKKMRLCGDRKGKELLRRLWSKQNTLLPQLLPAILLYPCLMSAKDDKSKVHKLSLKG